jgi:glycine amidinotransferase/scyllo-inosamine-4-phosphate amidinotransferase 1
MISSHNEWDPVREIVVGSATGANWPSTDPVFSQESTKTTWTETPVPSGAVPQWIIDEANWDLDQLAAELVRHGAIVRRPRPRDFVATQGMYNYCPRDRLLIAGNTIVDCAMMYPCRDQEIDCLESVTDQTSRILHMPRDQGLVLDAANICRLGDTWLFLESASGNLAAYQWLCSQFPDINIELCNFYAGVHIDSTIVPINQGLVMVNSSRVNKYTLPKVLQTDWEIIWIDDVVPQGFYQYPYASKWIAMNMLVLDPTTVIVDSNQPRLMDLLDLYGIDVVPMCLRHSRTLGGGFHCVTLDLWRQNA